MLGKMRLGFLPCEVITKVLEVKVLVNGVIMFVSKMRLVFLPCEVIAVVPKP